MPACGERVGFVGDPFCRRCGSRCLGEPRAEAERSHQIVEPVGGIFEQHLLLELGRALAVDKQLEAMLALEQRPGRSRPGELDARTEVLKLWVDAGMMLGNHGFSHLRLLTTPLLKYEEDVIKGEVITRRLMSGREPYQLYFRHPYTRTGPTREVKAEFESFLREHGYKVAPFTIENSDYIFNQIYFDARRNNDTALMERLRKTYLDYNDGQFEFIERLSSEMFGREISQILLIHANDINSDCLDEMLKRLAARGYRFVTLDQALEDKAYQTRDDYVGLHGPSWLHRWTVSMRLKMKLDQEPDPPKWVLDMFQKRN